MTASMLVIEFLGVIIGVTALPMDVQTCNAGMIMNQADLVAPWLKMGFSLEGLRLRCVEFGAVVLRAGVPL